RKTGRSGRDADRRRGSDLRAGVDACRPEARHLVARAELPQRRLSAEEGDGLAGAGHPDRNRHRSLRNGAGRPAHSAGRPGAAAATAATGERPSVAVTRIARGDLAQTLTLAAEFRPYQEIEVHAKVAGYLKSISVDVGDRVTAGQLLAVLEIPELQDDMATDEASVKRSSEEVNRAQADIGRAESAHDVAHLGASRLAAVMKQRPNLVAQQDIDEAQGRDRIAEAQVATARAEVAAAQEQL